MDIRIEGDATPTGDAPTGDTPAEGGTEEKEGSTDTTPAEEGDTPAA